MSGVARAVKLISEPKAINAAQIVLYLIAAICGGAAAFGAVQPTFMAFSIGPVLIALVGGVLVAGGITGTVSVLTGMWWLERIALIVVGLGWFMLLPAAVYYASSGKSPAIWLVVALVTAVLCDVFKRYRRIDWAYLDPTR